MKQNGIAIAVFVIFVVIGWTAAVLLHLKGSNFWILLGAFAALGLIAAGALLWWLRARQAAAAANAANTAGGAPEAAEGEQEIDLLMRQAESRLKSSRLGRQAALGKLPVILLGETGVGKTSVMLGSSLDPELLAGQVSQDNKVAPTRAVNLWFARQVIFVEAAGKLLTETPSWAQIARRIAPGRFHSVFSRREAAPRAAVVCVSLESLLKPGTAQENANRLRALRASLDECSRRLGISLPVYVLFTKIDRAPFFADYAENLTPAEAAQVFGATLPIRAQSTTGIYAEQESQRLSAAFDELFYSLSEHRIELLSREHNAERLPGIYEFPREFRKLRNAVVQFLVDLCRPSQLTTSPFLRGFYFAGTRSVLVEAEAEPQTLASEAADAEMGATRVFSAGQLRRLTTQQPQGLEDASGATRIFDPRKAAMGGIGASAPRTQTIQQPVFLGHLFHEVLLKDRAGLAASSASARVNFWRRFLLAAAAVICLIFSIGLIVSFLGNRALESEVARAARTAQANPNASLAESLR